MIIPKLIALDMDGTMLSGENLLTERTIKALRAAQDEGIRIMVATGRMYCAAMKHISRIGLNGLSVFYNGALIRNTATDETYYEQTVGRELTAEIMHRFHEENWYIQAYQDDKLLVVDSSDERCKYYERLCGVEAVSVGDALWTMDIDASKLLGICFDKPEYIRMCNTVNREFGKKVYYAPSWGSFIEMVHPAVNKAKSVERVSNYYGIPREEVMALGDGGNDVEMIRWAGIGVAMDNAKDRVKEAADIIAPPASEDGAAYIVEKVTEFARDNKK